MADCILQFLQYGASAEPIAALPASITAPFLPSLVLSSVDSPALLPHLLPSLSSHRQVPKALTYAGLDYAEIALSVLEEEAEESGAKDVSTINVAVVEEATEMTLDDDELGVGGEESSKLSNWKWEYDDKADECYAFEVADERDRVRLVVLSLRRNARKFYSEAMDWGGAMGKNDFNQQEKDQGSIWNNAACLPELLCLLPITVSRCPTLLTPEVLVKGLLSASSGRSLLVTTFANNPTIVERGALVLASVFSSQGEVPENHAGSPHASETISGAKTGGGTGILPRQHAQELTPPLPAQYVHRITMVLVSLCRVAPSIAASCREALVKTCTLAEMTLHITLEIFHDELQFLSKLIFPMERPSRWILSFLGSSHKHGDNHQGLVPLPPLVDRDKDDIKTYASAKGVTTRVRDSLLADAISTWKKQGWCGKLHAHLRLYCVLIRAADMQPTHEEVDFWIRVLGGTYDLPSVEDGAKSTKSQTFVSERTLQLGICFVCLVPGLSSPSTKNLLHACIANLLRAAMGSTPSLYCTPEIELAVWVSVQLLLRRFPDIAGLVRKSLGMHVTVHTASMRDLADAGLSDAFVTASAAAALRPSGPIPSNRLHQCLGLKCLEQLLNRSTFAQCGVDISDTVMHYICIAGEPIHPVLPSIVHGFAELSAPAPAPSRTRPNVPRFRMRPFSQDSLIKAMAPGFAILRNKLSNTKISSLEKLPRSMKELSSSNGINLRKLMASEKDGTGDPLATAALATYYVLCREQISWNLGTSGSATQENAASMPNGQEKCWWSDLLSDLPLRELLMYMEVNWPAYEHLLPQWLCVASVVFPQRFTAQALLNDLEKTNTSFHTHVKGVPVTGDLDWVGPPFECHVQKKDADLIRAPSQRTILQTAGGVPPVKRDLSLEKSTSSPMDLDKEQLRVPLLDAVGENIQSLATGAVKENSMAGSNLFTVETITTAMRNALQHPLPALRILKTMMAASHLGNETQNLEVFAGFGVDWTLETTMMSELVPHLLDSTCPRCLQNQFCSWWHSLPSSSLEYLGPKLWELIKDRRVPTSGDSFRNSAGPLKAHFKQSLKNAEPVSITLRTSGLVDEPLKLLACNSKVFRSPILSIILQLLLELLAANRRVCDLATMDGGRDARDAAIKREEVSGAMVAQDSAVCQILLEACLPNKELGDEDRPGPLLEAHTIICTFICSMIQKNPLLLKLLHFQGYDIRLIPMMVRGVPATVQCLEFIGELLRQSQQQRLVFAVALTGHLVRLHPDLPQSLAAAQKVVGQVTHMRTKVAGCAGYLREVLGPVAQCASAFPSLAPQVIALLQSCAQAGGPLMRSGPPRDPALHDAAITAFKCLVQGKLLHGRPLPLSG